MSLINYVYTRIPLCMPTVCPGHSSSSSPPSSGTHPRAIPSSHNDGWLTQTVLHTARLNTYLASPIKQSSLELNLRDYGNRVDNAAITPLQLLTASVIFSYIPAAAMTRN